MAKFIFYKICIKKVREMYNCRERCRVDVGGYSRTLSGIVVILYKKDIIETEKSDQMWTLKNMIWIENFQ